MGAIDRIFRGRRGGQERPLAAQIAALFANGEQGLWYDPSDLSTVYRDASGSLPAYMPGQGQVDPPVGLILDKRLRLVRSADRITSSWSVDSGVTESGGVITFSSAPSSSFANNTGVVVAGRWYEVRFTITGFSGDGGVSWAFAGNSIGNVCSANGTYTQIVLATASGACAVRARLAATTAVVGGISVRELAGNHAYQATTTSRPTLSARYNLLTYTEDFDAAAWTKVGASVSANSAPAPNGQAIADKLIEDTTSSQHYIQQGISISAGTYTLCVHAKAAGRTRFQFASQNGFIPSAEFDLVAVTATTLATTSSATITDIGGGWYRCTATRTVAAGTDAVLIRLVNSAGANSYVGDGVSGVLIYGADHRVTNDGVGIPTYQRVVDATTYDTAGFPLYLRFDGVDDYLQTASIDFSSTDKVLVVAALRKFSDTATGLIFELSANSNTINGAFLLAAPSSNGVNKLRFASKGTALSEAITTSSAFSAPLSLVVAGRSDIAADLVELRANGVLIATGVSDQGTGNLSAGPVFIGRRGDGTIPFSGRLYGCLIRSGAANDSQILKVEKFLNQKAKVA